MIWPSSSVIHSWRGNSVCCLVGQVSKLFTGRMRDLSQVKKYMSKDFTWGSVTQWSFEATFATFLRNSLNLNDRISFWRRLTWTVNNWCNRVVLARFLDDAYSFQLFIEVMFDRMKRHMKVWTDHQYMSKLQPVFTMAYENTSRAWLRNMQNASNWAPEAFSLCHSWSG